ncbi:MAG: hypothetical protein ACI8TP_003144 [Acidimicrobiales bacterium]|jgi:hypothetical protein
MFRDVHAAFAWVVVVANGVAGVWALAAERLEWLRSKALWWFIGFAEVGVAIQVMLGVAALRFEDRNASDFHMFYGFIAFATVGIIYSYRLQLEAWRFRLYGFGGLFLMGLGIRALLLKAGG